MNELSEFIKVHVNEINNNNFAKVYEDANDLLTPYLLTSKLTELFLDAGLEPLEYMQAVPANYLAYSKLTSVTIPDNITSISSSAFCDCSGLKSITIPDSVTRIGKGAFRGCIRLTSVTIGNNVTSIGSSAFDNCKSLMSITIPDSVTSIGHWAFQDCTGLTSVTIGNGVKSISRYAFWDCASLEDIYFNGTKDQWNVIKKIDSGIKNCTIHCTDGDLKE